MIHSILLLDITLYQSLIEYISDKFPTEETSFLIKYQSLIEYISDYNNQCTPKDPDKVSISYRVYF